ncbi:uncharacterized protein LOC131891109 [Tigriopus californicus]|nr:uncharacterized protein LOC131891109 [Tigriopus californicus]
MFFNNDQVVSCGASRGCDSYNIVPEIPGISSFGFGASLVNISSVKVFNGNTWLLGGIDKHTNKPSTDTYMYLSNTQLLKTEIEMPQPMTMSCSAEISDSHYFLVNGLSGDCFIYDVAERRWISIPGLLSPKSEEVLCAVAYNNGDPLVIVDGWMGDEGKDEPSQIFHVASQTWSFAPGETNYVIPYHSALLPLGNSVISVGGFVIDETGQRVMNSWVRMYDLETGNWVKRGPQLEDPNGGAVHLLVSKSLEMCKPKT